MDARYSPQTDQRAGVRPISFALETYGSIGSLVTLAVRPEDLTRTEPTRATVNQTFGRQTQGWVDHFGAGLPSATISGHTGWGYKPGLGRDGYQSFEALHDLVVTQYNGAKQAAIDTGRDPSTVKLLFVDLLDNFSWSVVPTQFVLRRSKSRPLLFQYNITLQAVSTSIEDVSIFMPASGSVFAGLNALDGSISTLTSIAATVDQLVSSAVSVVDRTLSPIGATVKSFMLLSAKVYAAVASSVRSANNGIIGTANRLISIASDMAQTGLNVFRSLAAIQGISQTARMALSRVASAYNEVLCIFRNSLKARKTFEDYSGIYGASNCSSTTGGRPASPYASTNVFSLMQPDATGVTINSTGLSSLGVLSRADPIAAPVPPAEIGRHLSNIVGGVQ